MVRRAVRRPFATVVLVVRDAEAHIVRALESVLNQDFDDIQVVVSDRASHDRTRSMCRTIAERDIRVDVVENDSSDFAQSFDAAIAPRAAGTSYRWLRMTGLPQGRSPSSPMP